MAIRWGYGWRSGRSISDETSGSKENRRMPMFVGDSIGLYPMMNVDRDKKRKSQVNCGVNRLCGEWMGCHHGFNGRIRTHTALTRPSFHPSMKIFLGSEEGNLRHRLIASISSQMKHCSIFHRKRLWGRRKLMSVSDSIFPEEIEST